MNTQEILSMICDLTILKKYIIKDTFDKKMAVVTAYSIHYLEELYLMSYEDTFRMRIS